MTSIPVHCAHDAILPLSELKPNPANPNKHPPEQIKLLAKIIGAQGWRNPIVVSTRSGLITKGHGRLDAAKLLGTPTAPVDYQDYASESEELADMIADNRIAELAEADRAMLRDLAEQLDDGAFDMDLTGFDQAALEELMTAAPPESDVDAEPQIDKAEELAAKWKVKRGQTWELGNHRLMCGDSTKQEDVAALVNGDKIDMVFTDPPYGNNTGYGRGQLGVRKVAGDETTALLDVLPAFAQAVVGYCIVWVQWRTFPHLVSVFHEWELLTVIVWDKKAPGLSGRGGFGEQHEWCCVFRNIKRPFGFFRGNVVTEARERAKEGRNPHPTIKPTEVCREVMQPLLQDGDECIAEPFSGSGTTIIACEQLGRKCRAMEIDPGYVAVAIQRWADATGKTPRLLT